jgi:hypothetical protein
MELTLQPSTSIAANGKGAVNYIGPWADCLAALAHFRVKKADGDYSFAAWRPGAKLEAAPERGTIAADADAAAWAAKEAEVAAAGKLISLGATVWALTIEGDFAPGG